MPWAGWKACFSQPGAIMSIAAVRGGWLDVSPEKQHLLNMSAIAETPATELGCDSDSGGRKRWLAAAFCGEGRRAQGDSAWKTGGAQKRVPQGQERPKAPDAYAAIDVMRTWLRKARW